MRELKFRAWDKVTKRYYAVDSLAYDDDGNLCEVYLAGIQINESNPNANVRLPNEVVLEQYTGLKDKNNKEIYEGDIVKVVEVLKFVVRYTRAFCAFELQNIDREDYMDLRYENVKRYEVIGNIYENPELLEEE